MFERIYVFLFLLTVNLFKNWKDWCSTFLYNRRKHFFPHRSLRVVQETLLKLFIYLFILPAIYLFTYLSASNVFKCAFCREQQCLTLFLRETFAWLSWGEMFVSCLANGCVTFAVAVVAAAAVLKAPGDKGVNCTCRRSLPSVAQKRWASGGPGWRWHLLQEL